MRLAGSLAVMIVCGTLAWGGEEPDRMKMGDQVVVELVGGSIIVGRYAGQDGLAVVIEIDPKGGGMGEVKVPEARVVRIRRVGIGQIASSGAPAAPASRPAVKEETVAAGDEGEGVELTEQQQGLLTLLTDFPPEKGWTSERYEEIGRKDFILGLRPTLQEARFKTVYPDWLEARALRMRLDRGEPPNRPQHELSPAAAWERFSDTEVWTEEAYGALQVRVFADEAESWREGKELAASDRDEESLTEEETSAIRFYRIFPEEAGWTEARLSSLGEVYAEGEALTSDERVYVLAYPDYLEGRSMYARAQAAKREADISYDEVQQRTPQTDVGGENISTGTVSGENVKPLGGEE